MAAARPARHASGMESDSPMTAQTPFSYGCTRCSRCCVDKLIQVNPYEVARLARNVGTSTGEFRRRFTDGARLNQDEAGRCVFLGDQGCTVHADRPLVCRLFPLGRVIDESGAVTFSIPRYDPGARGSFGVGATVADYLEAQGAGPFIEAADAYFAWYIRAHRLEPAAIDGAADADLLDLDEQVAGWCRASSTAEPHDLEVRRRLHLEILSALIEEGDES